MATASEKWHKIIHAYYKVPLSMRDELVWYMNEATFRELARMAGMPEENIKVEKGTQLMGLPIEIVESQEILLVMKVA